MSAELTGPSGEARLVPLDRLEHTHGSERATIAYWWIRLAHPYMMVIHVPPGSDPQIISADNIALVPMAPGSPDRLDTFALCVITLADLDGVEPATKRFPWSTHELIVVTLDPTHPHDFEDPPPWPTMSPVNLSLQFEVDNDDQALVLAESAARGIVHGLLPPEIQAFVPELAKMMTVEGLHHMWEDSIRQTAEHLRTHGSHADRHPRSGS